MSYGIGMVADASLFTGQIESNYDEVTDSFDSMNLKSELLRGKSRAITFEFVKLTVAGVYAYGFERPSAIQQRAIMPVIKGLWESSSS